MPPEICPICGATVPTRARACPECGADDQTGWSQDVHYDGVDLPEEQFDYEEFVGREFGLAKAKPRGVRWVWWVVALALAGLLLTWWLH